MLKQLVPALCFPPPDTPVTTEIHEEQQRLFRLLGPDHISHAVSSGKLKYGAHCAPVFSPTPLLWKHSKAPARCYLFYNAPIPSRIASTCSTTHTFCSTAPCFGCFPTPKEEYSPGRKASCSQTRCCWAWRADGQGRWRDSRPATGWSQNSLPWPGKQQREKGKIKPRAMIAWLSLGRQSGHQHEIPVQPSGLLPPLPHSPGASPSRRSEVTFHST